MAALSDGADDILLSLSPRHANNVFSGVKSVEIRRRAVNVPVGTRVWIYAKLPVGAVMGFATIAKVDNRSPEAVWKLYGAKSAIEKTEFQRYLQGRDNACAIVLKDVTNLARAMSLKELRKLKRTFHPPQFFSKLNGLAEPLRRAATFSVRPRQLQLQLK